MVAVVADATVVLGLGDIGLEYAFTVMEGKVLSLKKRGGVNKK